MLLVAGILAGALTGTSVAVIGGASAPDPRVQRCGVGGSVAAVFDIAKANAIWQYLPAMKRPPELINDNAPASIVVYAGKVEGVVLGPAGMQRDQASDAVCVIQSSGEVLVFVNVSRSGFVAP